MLLMFKIQKLITLLLNFTQVDSSGTSYKLIDGNEIPAVALGTSLGHLSDVSTLRTSKEVPTYLTDLQNKSLCNDL